MIPKEIRDFETYIVAYSGGKDSTATLLWALEHLPREKLRVINNPTGASWPIVSNYLSYIGDRLNIEIEGVQAGDRPLPLGSKERQTWASATNLFDMIQGRGMWPSYWQRYCTKYLKMWPLRLYAAEFENPLLIFGERAEESEHRSKLPMFGPDTFKGMKAYQFPNFRPILNWSEDEVWDYLSSHSIEPNPVYSYTSRCGCWCCPLKGNAWTILNFCRLYPDIAQQAADLEKEISHTWKYGQSIGNLLRQAQAQLPLFEPQLRFGMVGSL